MSFSYASEFVKTKRVKSQLRRVTGSARLSEAVLVVKAKQLLGTMTIRMSEVDRVEAKGPGFDSNFYQIVFPPKKKKISCTAINWRNKVIREKNYGKRLKSCESDDGIFFTF